MQSDMSGLSWSYLHCRAKLRCAAFLSKLKEHCLGRGLRTGRRSPFCTDSDPPRRPSRRRLTTGFYNFVIVLKTRKVMPERAEQAGHRRLAPGVNQFVAEDICE